MKIEKKLAEMKYYGDKRSTNDIKYIVVQTFGNKASTHYHIKDGKAIQIIPDNYMSDAINGARLTLNGYLHGICTKYNCISIGVPSNLSEDDKQTCLNLIMTIKQRYKVNNDNIVRQMDVTGEHDPDVWRDNYIWNKDIKNKLIDI